MSALYHTTGSGTYGTGEPVPICLVDGDQAVRQYGVAKYSGGPCPKCKFPVDQVLLFNPTDGGHYYFKCPVCGVVLRLLNPDGSVSDLEEVKSTKTTELDIETDVPWYENW
jgi:hypothetical protein